MVLWRDWRVVSSASIWNRCLRAGFYRIACGCLLWEENGCESSRRAVSFLVFWTSICKQHLLLTSTKVLVFDSLHILVFFAPARHHHVLSWSGSLEFFLSDKLFAYFQSWLWLFLHIRVISHSAEGEVFRCVTGDRWWRNSVFFVFVFRIRVDILIVFPGSLRRKKYVL